MYYCDICGRELKKKIKLHGYTLCSKHMHQILKYGHALDTNPRTTNDLNDFKIHGETTTFNLYNQANEFVGTFDIDTEDLNKVRYHKWRLSHSHVVTGLPSKGTQRDVAHVVLDFNAKESDLVVDHIDGNPMNNKKSNLRICSQAMNVQNKAFMSNNSTGFLGISYAKDKKKYAAEIQYGEKRVHLCARRDLAEAVYERYIAEKIMFKEFANEAEQNKKYEFSKNLPQEKKDYLEKITIEKLQKYFGNKLY